MSTTTYPETWSFLRKITFRFAFTFFTLIIFPFPLTMLPVIEKLGKYYEQLQGWLVNLVGRNVLGETEPIVSVMTGSGDTLYAWTWQLVVLLLTIVIVVVWTALDRNRRNYARMKGWFLLYVAYHVAFTMLTYGIIKLFQLQFSAPGLARLFETYGQSSPMRVMWTFMGVSPTYLVFAGACETVAGILLLFRRTRTIGALAAFGVMLNVFMMNMSFDIPVKLFSLQIVVMSAYLFAQHWRRMFAFFFTDKAVPAPVYQPLVTGKKSWWALVVVQVIFGVACIAMMSYSGMEGKASYGVDREKPALYGAYEVDYHVVNGDTLPPLLTDTVRWHRVLFDYPEYTQIMLMNDGMTGYRSNIDTTQQKIYFTERGEDATKDSLNYQRIDQDLLLTGQLGGDTLTVYLSHYGRERFGLLNRGFHWVSERPYNRYNRE